MTDTLALVLAGGRGSRLRPLTTRCAKPALPIAGRYSVIDFALSNCLNSAVPRIGVLVQYLSDSVMPHLEAWNSLTIGRECSVRGLQPSDVGGYKGTADAVYQNRNIIRALAPSYVLILAADHAYRMDYGKMLADHQRRGAEVTVGCVEVSLEQARDFGVMEIDPDRRIRKFLEKPQSPSPLFGRDDVALASMGVYIFNTSFLLETLADDAARPTSSHDFGSDVIPAAVQTRDAYAHSFRDPCCPAGPAFWRDVGTLDAYWRTNMELAGAAPILNLDEDMWPIRTSLIPRGMDDRSPRVLGSLKHSSSRTNPGAAKLHGSVLFPGVRIGPGAVIEDSVVLPGARVPAGCIIRKAVIESGMQLVEGERIGFDPVRDRDLYCASPDGVVLVP